MAERKGYFVFMLVISFLLSVTCLPEPGKKELNFDKNRTYGKFSKTMNKGYSVVIKGKCEGYSGSVVIRWRLEVSECAEWFSFVKDNDEKEISTLWDLYANHSLNGEQEVPCNTAIHLQDMTGKKELVVYSSPASAVPDDESHSDDTEETDDKNQDKTESAEKSSKTLKASPSKKLSAKTFTKKQTLTSHKVSSTVVSKPSAASKVALVKKEPKESNLNRKRRSEDPGKSSKGDTANQDGEPEESDSEAEDKAEPTSPKEQKPSSSTAKGTTTDVPKVENRVCVTTHDGVYLLIVNAFPKEKAGKEYKLTLNVEMEGKYGYLSASDWPLYPFYGVMSLLYVFYGVVWLIVSACQWRDLLRIQFWIGGVIALGMLEKALFFSEYNNINITGETNPSLTIFAELVSCVKRTLARILVIIVSMGFGIVKPRLGTALHRVLGVGAVYFILATVEGCFRALHPKSDPSRQQLIASIPLAVLDASICWWIFMSLVQTTRTLRIRRNLIKLSLYRHFTNTLIFAVLASVAYMIWSIKTHRFAKDGCITDWSELWLDEAFWHFLFSIVLLVIMVLWRPTANNQRYAFTPIVDFGDDDEDDDNMTLSDAFDGMKMRNVKNVPEVLINGDSKRKHKPEDDLKWVEENIPSSAADAVLPSVLDSDEELMTTKFEMSKME